MKKTDPFSKLKNKRTLLVDDDELIRDSLGLAFKNKGCSMLTLETAEEALRKTKRERFDIIISDFKLPGMDGLEFIKRVIPSQPNALNVLITAYGDKGLASEASAIGVHDLVEKPFSVMALAESLTRLIENGKEDKAGDHHDANRIEKKIREKGETP